MICLDIGCGGRKLPYFIGIDIDKKSDADVICDVHNLPFKDKSVDFIFANGIFCYVNADKAISEIKRVLKGKFIIYDVLGDNLIFRFWRWWNRGIFAPACSWYEQFGNISCIPDWMGKWGFKIKWTNSLNLSRH